MFRDCARLERNVFVTWKECDVDEQDVVERKECWERKKVLRKKKRLSHIWVKPESDLGQILTRLLTSFNHYAENSLAFTANWLKLQSCSVLFSLNTLVTVKWRVDEQVNKWVKWRVNEQVDRRVKWRVNEWVNRWVEWKVNE